MQNFNKRLIGERQRLGLKKGGMARAGGVANSTYTKYEDGSRLPDAAFLAAIAAEGADIQYILTGERSGKCVDSTHLDQKAAESNGKFVNSTNLPLDEQMLLMAFRTLDKAGKTQALGLISGLEPAETPQKTSSNPKFVVHGNVGQIVDAPIKSKNFTIDMRKGVDKKDE